jgi:hypothetical protein
MNGASQRWRTLRSGEASDCALRTWEEGVSLSIFAIEWTRRSKFVFEHIILEVTASAFEFMDDAAVMIQLQSPSVFVSCNEIEKILLQYTIRSTIEKQSSFLRLREKGCCRNCQNTVAMFLPESLSAGLAPRQYNARIFSDSMSPRKQAKDLQLCASIGLSACWDF